MYAICACMLLLVVGTPGQPHNYNDDAQTASEDDVQACKVHLLQRSMALGLVEAEHTYTQRGSRQALLKGAEGGIAGHIKHSDVRLELPDVLAETCSDNFGAYGATSPSFLSLPHSSDVVAVFRGLCLADATDILPKQRWKSSLVIGSMQKAEMHGAKTALNWTMYSRIQDPRFMHHTHLKECITPYYLNVKKLLVEGPEDPKLFTNNGKHYLMFIAEPVKPEASSDDTAFSSRPDCGHNVFLPHIVQLTSLPPQLRFGPVLQLTFQGMHREEKNWLPFNWKPSNGSLEHALMVYDMHPHTIMKVNMSTGHLMQMHAEYSPLLISFAQEVGVQPSEFHGNGAGVVPVPCEDGRPCNLAVFHLHKDNRSDGWYNRTYMHWPYIFSAEPPFEIKAVAKKQLPLRSSPNPVIQGWDVQFVTSFLEDAGHIIIGYNTGDQESNIFRMLQSEFQSEYF